MSRSESEMAFGRSLSPLDGSLNYEWVGKIRNTALDYLGHHERQLIRMLDNIPLHRLGADNDLTLC